MRNANWHEQVTLWIPGCGGVRAKQDQKAAKRCSERQAKPRRAMPEDEGFAIIKSLYLPGNNSCPKPGFQGTALGVIQMMQFALLYRIVHLNEQSHKDNFN